VKLQNDQTEEYRIHYCMAQFEFLNYKEAKAYLDMFDWDVQKAVVGIQDDLTWEQEHSHSHSHPHPHPTLIKDQENQNNRVVVSYIEKSEMEEKEEEREPLLVVGLPLDVNLIKGNIHRAMNHHHNHHHHHEKSSAATGMHGTGGGPMEFGIEMKDLTHMRRGRMGGLVVGIGQPVYGKPTIVALPSRQALSLSL
jgi:hypothetical protein